MTSPKDKVDIFRKIATFLRYWALRMSTHAGSGHPSSALSAADLMAVFLSEVFRYDFKNPQNPYNDRLIFSKGHATPLYYGLFAAIGVIKPSELDNYRKFGSPLEGHPTPRFPYTEAATGSLGQGLSIGLGMALALQRLPPKLPMLLRSLKEKKTIGRSPRVFVLLGDGEMAEGSTWEAIEVASKYQLGNLVAIVDVNRLGQSGETMLGWDTDSYKRRFEAFGWETALIDGHNHAEIEQSFKEAKLQRDKPFVIIAKTIKGKGISILENNDGWHGKPIPPAELDKALSDLGRVDLDVKVEVQRPVLSSYSPKLPRSPKSLRLEYYHGQQIATRKAYGMGLTKLGEVYPGVISLDGDVKNSTYSEIFKEKFPDRFYEMYIAEQNMVGAAVGFSRMGFIPYVSTFACFLTRAFDQIRMAAISEANIKFCGSHAGVSIGEDGPSQMGLEDIAMFRSVYDSVVLYPADAVATEKLVFEMAKQRGISYIRTTRPTTPVIYDNSEEFPIGGSKIHARPGLASLQGPALQKVVIVAAGITLFEALKAQEILAKESIEAIIVDCYSIKPIDEQGLKNLVKSAFARPGLANGGGAVHIITVEDHWFEGGLGDAVLNVFSDNPKVQVHKLAVSKMPRSGKPSELLAYEEIDAAAIAAKVKSLL